jgi:hypothetical protein
VCVAPPALGIFCATVSQPIRAGQIVTRFRRHATTIMGVRAANICVRLGHTRPLRRAVFRSYLRRGLRTRDSSRS